MAGDMDIEVWDKTFDVNARGTMLMIKHALPALIKSGDAAIINTSSGAALLGDLARTAYAASKSAVNALTLYVAAQYGKQGRSEEHTSELQSLMRHSYAVFCLKKKNKLNK